MIPIAHSFVQKGILSQRGVSSNVFQRLFMSTTSVATSWPFWILYLQNLSCVVLVEHEKFI